MNFFESNFKVFFFNIYTCQFRFNKNVDFDRRFFFSLRGALGYNLKKITCITKSFDCKNCLLKFNCAYKYIFETEPPPDTDVLKKYDAIPQPFLFNNFNKKSARIVSFNLILIGKSIDYLPFLVYTFDYIGKEEGLGKDRIKFKLAKIYSYNKINDFFNSQSLLIYKDEKLLNKNSVLKFEELENIIPENVNKISLEFVNPVRIKHQSKLIKLPEFHIIIRALLHRISALMYFHCNIPLNIDFKEIIEKSKYIKLIKHNIKWKEYQRFSTRQKERLRLGGFVGNAEYEGELSIFLPLLYAGMFINIGKQTSFGLGEYKVILQ